MLLEDKHPSASPALAKAGRSTAPVFVLGCPRSGTTVLYHMLLSSGNFAVYRSESNVFNLLAPRFGAMRSPEDRKQLMRAWLSSKLYRVSGLNSDEITSKIMANCQSAGDFLQIVMGEIARKQGVSRWADCTPEHLLYMEQIKREIPDALFIHIIRDGRDVALSYVKQGWAYPLPGDRNSHLEVAGLYWEWLVRKGREQGKRLGNDYQEVRFETLVSDPQQTLSQLAPFIAQDLDYQKIQAAGIGSVSEPNTSFSEAEGTFNPIGRWKTKMSAKQIAEFETLMGDVLLELGYPLEKREATLRSRRLRAIYLTMFAAKHWIKTNTPLGRSVNLERIETE